MNHHSLLILGDSHVGKTRIFKQLMGTYEERPTYAPTFGLPIGFQIFKSANSQLDFTKYQLIDTAGNESWRLMNRLYERKFNTVSRCVIILEASQENNLRRLKRWVEQLTSTPLVRHIGVVVNGDDRTSSKDLSQVMNYCLINGFQVFNWDNTMWKVDCESLISYFSNQHVSFATSSEIFTASRIGIPEELISLIPCQGIPQGHRETDNAENIKPSSNESFKRKPKVAEAIKAAEGKVEKDAKKLAAEEKAKKDAMQLAAEEKAKKDAMQLAAEEQAKQDAMQLAAEEKAKKDAMQLAAEEKAKQDAMKLAAGEQAKANAMKLAAEEKAKKDAMQLAAEEKAKTVAMQLAAEQQAKTEAMKLAAEEQAKANAMKLAAEEKAEKDAMKLAAEEHAKANAMKLASEEKAKKDAMKRAAEEKAKKDAMQLAAEQQAKTDAMKLAAEKEAKANAANRAAEKQARADAALKFAEDIARADAAKKDAEQKARAEAANRAAEKQAKADALHRAAKMKALAVAKATADAASEVCSRRSSIQPSLRSSELMSNRSSESRNFTETSPMQLRLKHNSLSPTSVSRHASRHKAPSKDLSSPTLMRPRIAHDGSATRERSTHTTVVSRAVRRPVSRVRLDDSSSDLLSLHSED